FANQEAECCEPGIANVLYRPVRPPPIVDFLQPRENLAVRDAQLKVRFQVRSPSPLKRVQLLQEGSAPIPVNCSTLRPRPDGSYELNTEVGVQLRRGLNPLRVVAVNDGGEQDTALIVNF